MVKVLIQCSTFYLQCVVFPSEINLKKVKGKMFGQLLAILEDGVIDENTQKFIKKCKLMNTIRVKMVHKITLKTDIHEISSQINPVKKLYNEIYDLFDEIFKNYRLIFKNYKKKVNALKELA